MIEKGNEESDSLGKYKGMLMSTIIAALIVWIAPELIPIITGADGGIFDPPTLADPTLDTQQITDRISDLFTLLLWFVRIAILAGVIISVLMLHVPACNPRTSASSALNVAAIAKQPCSSSSSSSSSK